MSFLFLAVEQCVISSMPCLARLLCLLSLFVCWSVCDDLLLKAELFDGYCYRELLKEYLATLNGYLRVCALLQSSDHTRLIHTQRETDRQRRARARARGRTD